MTGAYVLKSGEGERFLAGRQLVTRIATGGEAELVVFEGGRGAGAELHSHELAHQTLYVLDGQAEVWLDGYTYTMSRGDFTSVPPGVTHGYRMKGHRTRILSVSVGEGPADFGEPTHLQVFPAEPGDTGSFGPVGTEGRSVTMPPDRRVPYVIAAGEGERLVTGDQMFTFLAHQASTDGRFLVLGTQGPKGERIPMHFHEKHTEMFFCLEGAMTMWVNGQEVTLGPGDFVHAPAGTVHSFRLDGHFNNFLGVLAPGLFEPFFRTLCDPYDGYIYPEVARPARFDRLMAKLPELDLKFVEKPAPHRG